MKYGAALILTVVTLPSVGCGKKDTGATPAASGSSALAAAKSGKCVAGAYKDPHGVYCVVLPEGFKPPKATSKEDATKSRDQFESDDGFAVVIDYWKPNGHNGDFASTKQLISTASGDLKKVASTDFEGGNGFYTRQGRRQSEKDVQQLRPEVRRVGDHV